MAEGFANYYGKGWIRAYSAGSHPVGFLMPHTLQVMREKGIDISQQTSSSIKELNVERMDYVVILEASLANLGKTLAPHIPKLFWFVSDPVGKSVEAYRIVRDQLEVKVVDFVEAIRKES